MVCGRTRAHVVNLFASRRLAEPWARIWQRITFCLFFLLSRSLSFFVLLFRCLLSPLLFVFFSFPCPRWSDSSTFFHWTLLLISTCTFSPTLCFLHFVIFFATSRITVFSVSFMCPPRFLVVVSFPFVSPCFFINLPFTPVCCLSLFFIVSLIVAAYDPYMWMSDWRGWRRGDKLQRPQRTKSNATNTSSRRIFNWLWSHFSLVRPNNKSNTSKYEVWSKVVRSASYILYSI